MCNTDHIIEDCYLICYKFNNEDEYLVGFFEYYVFFVAIVKIIKNYPLLFEFLLPVLQMRNKLPTHRLPCARDKCCGVSNQHQNFLSVTSRGNTRSNSKNSRRSKKRVKRVKKKESAIKQILNQTNSHLHELQEENQQLIKKLNMKKKKIEDLKAKLKQYEDEIKRYRELEKKWIEGHEEKSERHTKSKEAAEEKNFAKLIQDSHNMAKQTLERYKKLEEQYDRYRENAQKKIDKLKAEKQRLISEGAETSYNRQIQQLKQQLNRFRQDQITVSSLKNLHQSNGSHQQKLKIQITTLKAHNSTLKSENNKLKEYVKELQQQLQQRTTGAHHKQRELKNNLDVINSKINIWEKDYKALKEQSANWEQDYNTLLSKYQYKKQKYKANNAEWAQIFKQFINQIDKLKQELDMVSERNVKLIKMYGHQ